MSNDSFEETLERGAEKRRPDALSELRMLRDDVRARNPTLDAVDADALANRVSREMVDDLAESGKRSFERDTGSGT